LQLTLLLLLLLQTRVASHAQFDVLRGEPTPGCI
jgi:hypothetical protein